MTADIYLDHASATPLRPEARDAFVAALDLFGDPLHDPRAGPRARRLLDDARATVARCDRGPARRDRVHLRRYGVGGARDLGRRAARCASSARGSSSSAVEHPAVGGVCHVLESDGFEVVLVPVDEHGRIDLDATPPRCACRARCSRACSTRTTSWARCSRSRRPPGSPARRRCGSTPTPARRSAGCPSNVAALGVDLLSLSGAQVRRATRASARCTCDVASAITAYPCGDDRERKRRSGMENTPGIAAMAAALSASLATMADARGASNGR